MSALRRVLYLNAAVLAVAGLALLAAPRFVLETLFDQPAHQEFAWVRLFGAQALGLAMLMVLVAHRVQELWWWSWAFAFVAVVTAAVVLLHAAFDVGSDQSGVLWWVFAAIATALSMGLLYGLYAASREQPFP
jgi:hypothetical protein